VPGGGSDRFNDFPIVLWKNASFFAGVATVSCLPQLDLLFTLLHHEVRYCGPCVST